VEYRSQSEAYVHDIEQLFFCDVLAIVGVEQRGQRGRAAGIVQVLLDDALIAQGLPALDGDAADDRVGGEQHALLRAGRDGGLGAGWRSRRLGLSGQPPRPARRRPTAAPKGA